MSELKDVILAFHGTVEANVKLIQRSGFKKGTYFARHMEDAVAFGGPYVFTVSFLNDPLKWHGTDDSWQFTIRESIPPSEIMDINKVTVIDS